jgi:DNA-binding NarL/FixJ family response regulator
MCSGSLPPSQFAEYQRLAVEYRNSVARCVASMDQMRAAEREFNELAHALGQDGHSKHIESASAAIEESLDHLSGPVGETTRLLIGQLSDREFEVFALIGGGLSSREIAEHLHLALSTVETYRERLKGKLDLSSGHALIRAATIWALSQRLTDTAE